MAFELGICDPDQVTRQLARRLADRGQTPAVIQLDLFALEMRRSLREPPSKSSLRKYRGWRKVYEGWCRWRKYQTGAAFLTDQMATEFAEFLTSGDDPYLPNSVKQALSAMKYWAERAGAHPMPTFAGAYAVREEFIRKLESQNLVPVRVRARR